MYGLMAVTPSQRFALTANAVGLKTYITNIHKTLIGSVQVRGGEMIDPITAVGLATSAFNAIKNGIAVGRDIQDMSGQLAQWGKAFSDFKYAEDKAKNPPWYSFKGSDNETAIEIFAQKKKMEAMRTEIKSYISWHYGPSGWDEVLAIEAQMRKQRKEELYRKEEFKRLVLEWTVGILTAVLGLAFIGIVLYFIGVEQGRW